MFSRHDATSSCRGLVRRPALAALVLSWASTFALAGASRAQPASAPDMPVSEVEIVLDGRPLRDDTVTRLVEVRPGEPLDPEDVRASIQHLVLLRRFASVDVVDVPSAQGRVVRFLLTPLQRIGDYEVAGAFAGTADALERAVRDRLGATPTAAQMPEAIAAAQAVLGEQGYLQPRLEPRLEPMDDQGTVRLVIDGASGPRWRIGRITLVGAASGALTAREVVGVEAGAPYDRPALQANEQAFVARQRAAGYYETVVRTTPSPGAAPQTIDLRVEVLRGPRVELSFTGDPIPADVRRELVPVASEGSVDEDLLEDSRARLEQWLRERGRWRAEVTYQRRTTDDGLSIVFDVRAGRRYETSAIVIGGQQAMLEAEVRSLMRLREGEPFSPALLAQSVTAITRAYQSRGYPAARVETALVDVSQPSLRADAEGSVEVRLRVEEGPETRVAAVDIEGVTALPLEDLRRALSVRPDALFSSAAVVADREALLRQYLDAGYRQAQVEAELAALDDRRRIAVTYRVSEGEQTLVDRVIVVGNVRVSDETVRRELALTPGGPFGLSQVFETQRRLTALGLFRSIRINDVDAGAGTRHDVVITVEEAPVTTVGYGAGLEAGQRLRTADAPPGSPAAAGVETRFEVAPRGFFEVGRRNFLGKNRSVNLFLRGSLRPRDFPGDPERDGTGLALSEYRVLGTWREPRAVFDAANLDVSAFVEQAIRSSFNFRRQAARAELSRLVGEHLTVIGRYGFGRTELYNARVAPEDQLNVDRLFPQFRLSSLSSSAVLDTRDDPLDPQRGIFASIDGEFAGRGIGSEVGFNKTYMQGFTYRRLGGSPIVVAGGARLGLARGLPRDVPRLGDDGQPLVDPDGNQIVDVVRDLPASERFFAGGDSTVRGFTLDRLGAPETLDRNGVPSGGNAVVIFNSEVRFPLWGSIGAVTFLDAGNVFLRVGDLDLADLRGAAGFGLRYRSPIGPIRVDLGFKLSRRTFINGEREGRTALHITVGQAF